MTILVDTLPTVQLSTVILPWKLLPKSDVTIDDNKMLIDQLSDLYEEFRLIHGNGRRQF
jgi:hypothetical protein